MTATQRTIHASLETTFSHNQAAREGAALRGELGIDAQLRAMSEQAKALRAAGDEAGYQVIKAEAIKINAERGN